MNPTETEELWITPPRLDHNNESNYLMTYAAFNAKSARVYHEAAHSETFSKPCWRYLPAKPVLFRQEVFRGNKDLLTVHAPLKEWVIFDLDNGTPTDQLNGRAWVFLFNTRERARDYKDDWDKDRVLTRGANIKTSNPVCFYQWPMTNKKAW